jgi:SPP1 family holin
MPTMLANDIFRIAIFVLSWVNSLLVSHGHKPIPVIDESQVSWAITFVVSVWAMVKESPFKSLFAKKVEAPVALPVQPVAPAQPEAPVEPQAVASPVQEQAPVKVEGENK